MQATFNLGRIKSIFEFPPESVHFSQAETSLDALQLETSRLYSSAKQSVAFSADGISRFQEAEAERSTEFA